MRRGLEPGEAIAYGGLQIGHLLALLRGSFGSVAASLLSIVYEANRDAVERDAARFMTPSSRSVDRMLDRLGIEDASDRDRVHKAVRDWGIEGGEVLKAIAAAKAGD